MAEKKSILLRLNPQLWEALSGWAEDEFRSINGQIEYILYDALIKNKRLKATKNLEVEKESKGDL